MKKVFFSEEENFKSIIEEALPNEEIKKIIKISTGWTNIVYNVKTEKDEYFFRFPRDEFWSRTIVKDYEFAKFIYGKTDFNTVNLQLKYDKENRPFSMHKKIEGSALADKIDNLTADEIKSVSNDIAKFMFQLHNIEFVKNDVFDVNNLGLDLEDFLGELLEVHVSEEDKEFWNKFMYSNDYQYRDRDIIIWKANANGVDLHYNFYEDGVNYDFTKTCVYKNNTESRYKCGYNLYNTYFENGSIKGTFSTEGYVGETGFSEPETKAIYDFIENNKIYEYAITYHGRGPAIMWNYTSKWENTKSLLARKKQFNTLSYAISKVSHIARTTNTNGPLGFSGWFQQKYHGLAINFEIGWSNWDKNNIGESFKQNKNGNYQANKSLPFDTCPLDASQLPYIWITQKDVPIELVYQIQDGKGLERVYTN